MSPLNFEIFLVFSTFLTAWKVPNTEFFMVRIFPHSVNLRIQSECGKIRTRKTPYLNTFHAVPKILSLRNLARQLSVSVSGHNHLVSFQLWWMEAMLQSEKLSKHFVKSSPKVPASLNASKTKEANRYLASLLWIQINQRNNSGWPRFIPYKLFWKIALSFLSKYGFL